ncbi:hypothetical protein [Paraburkholderia sp. SUR17]|uniref:nickel/cobalt transporter n=1 Tax=Paraburkholderia sp. SUR17 TaxID=3034358 RepID=UPI0024079528|nr:hypothetical protein [Paraburkholderia sp. SUR17]WEY39964.1 hypothetical protein P2869_06295 [Paraburkholderia sp. SUR17]
MLVDLPRVLRGACARRTAAFGRTLRGSVHGRGRAALTSLLAMTVLCVACVHAHAEALDVFGQPTGAASTTAVTPAVSDSVTAAPSWWCSDVPDFVRAGVGDWLRLQAAWNGRIEGFMAQWSHGASLAAWATLVVVSFGYGALHALGPGHGKLVVGTWLGSRRARVADAVLLSAWTATVQAFCAIGLVLGAAWFTHAGLMSVMPRAASMETVSYLLLCVTSAWAIRSRGARNQCCDEAPVVRLARDESAGPAQTASDAVDVRGGDEAVGGAYLRTRLTRVAQERPRLAAGASPALVRATADVRPLSKERARSRIRQIATLGLAAGMRPCIGAIFALVTSMANGALAAGVVATFAMATGVATTVAMIGLGSVGANRTLARLALRYRIRSARAGRVVAIGAIALILVVSALQLALLLSGVSANALS